MKQTRVMPGSVPALYDGRARSSKGLVRQPAEFIGCRVGGLPASSGRRAKRSWSLLLAIPASLTASGGLGWASVWP